MNETPNQVTNQKLFNNPISLIGFFVALLFLVGETVIIILDIMRGGHNAYVGILIYIVGPAILVFGLMLVPLGMWLEYRRIQKNKTKRKLPVIDLNSASDQKYIFVFSLFTLVFLFLTSVGSYQAYHITESNQFCGVMCHQVMTPEYTAYQNSSHANVDCVKCHIGPGADWFVKSKITGSWQLYAVLTDSYELPIDTPISNLRPARDTCEQCHWPEKFYESVDKTLVYYGSDEENTPYLVDLKLHVGRNPMDQSEHQGIHWHIGLDHTLEYYARDEDNLDIPWVRVTYDDGRVEEFIMDEEEPIDPELIPEEEIQTMDCIDCHNRPSHNFHSPHDAVNMAFMNKELDPAIPDLKAVLVELIGDEYETTEEGLETISSEMQDIYGEMVEEGEVERESLENAISTAHNIFKNNFFPEWKANWTKYPDHIGHYEFPGCYRCHDDKHMSKDTGKILKNDCNLCHTITRQGEGWDEIANLEFKQQEFVHPRGFEDLWKGQNCHECHGPGMM